MSIINVDLPFEIRRRVKFLANLSDIPRRTIALYCGQWTPPKQWDAYEETSEEEGPTGELFLKLIDNRDYFNSVSNIYSLRRHYHLERRYTVKKVRKSHKYFYKLKEIDSAFVFHLAWKLMFLYIRDVWLPFNHFGWDIHDPDLIAVFTNKVFDGIKRFQKWKTKARILQLHDQLEKWFDKIYIRKLFKNHLIKGQYNIQRESVPPIILKQVDMLDRQGIINLLKLEKRFMFDWDEPEWRYTWN